MSHLLAISVGPVQEFIAAARRTRDLWFGSYLLSEVSRAVAKAIELRGELIFPAASDAKNVANVILAKLNAEDPKEDVGAARKAALGCWREIADRAGDEVRAVIRTDAWNAQVEDVIEFYAAWVSWSGDYPADWDRVIRLLDGRKNCRDFKRSTFDDTGLPKSSLDGQRATVLLGPKPGELRETYRNNWPKKLRLSPGEQLDVVGVTKRLGKKKDESDPRYPSVTRIACDPWLYGVERRGELKALKTACKNLVEKGLNTVTEEHYQYFPYEGTIVYKDRHPDLIKELGLEPHDLDEVTKALAEIGGEPNPYLAVLVADGDRMGKAISRLGSDADHRDFSRRLAEFAEEAQTIVRDSGGVLIYAGGDDVLTFVPLDTCLDCAKRLHEGFGQLMKPWSEKTKENLTLSVGVAIGHFMENLEDLLEYGRAAEKDAKRPDRDGVAVHLHKRGGSPIKVRARWSEVPVERITHYAKLIRDGAIPGRLPYDLRQMAALYEDWPPDTVECAIRQDVLRVSRDKQPRSGRQDMLEIEEALKARVSDSASLLRFAEELLVARQVATALRQAGGGRDRILEVPS